MNGTQPKQLDPHRDSAQGDARGRGFRRARSEGSSLAAAH